MRDLSALDDADSHQIIPKRWDSKSRTFSLWEWVELVSNMLSKLSNPDARLEEEAGAGDDAGGDPGSHGSETQQATDLERSDEIASSVEAAGEVAVTESGTLDAAAGEEAVGSEDQVDAPEDQAGGASDLTPTRRTRGMKNTRSKDEDSDSDSDDDDSHLSKKFCPGLPGKWLDGPEEEATGGDAEGSSITGAETPQAAVVVSAFLLLIGLVALVESAVGLP